MVLKDYNHQSIVSLRAFFERTKKLIEILKEQGSFEDDQLEEAVWLQNSAFHNYRVSQALCEKMGYEKNKDEKVSLLSQIFEQISILETLIIEEKRKVQQQVVKLSRGKSVLKNFHSGEPSYSNFTKNV